MLSIHGRLRIGLSRQLIVLTTGDGGEDQRRQCGSSKRHREGVPSVHSRTARGSHPEVVMRGQALERVLAFLLPAKHKLSVFQQADFA